MPFIGRPSTSRAVLVIVASAILVMSSFAVAQPKMFKPGPGPDELWDVTMKMEIAGMPMAMPAQTMQVCMKKDRKQEALVPQQEDCRTSDVKTSGNRLTFKIVCTGKEPMTGTGDITSTPTSYDGAMTMKSTRRGEDMEMIQKFSGRKVGTCTDQSEQMVASVRAQGDAQLAQTCRDSMDRLQAMLFVGKDAICASQKQAFCDKVGGVAREAREPAGHRRSTRAYAANIKDAFAACGQDFAVVTKQACTQAVSTRDWAFVGGGYCDAEVAVVGDSNCKGRAFTGMDRNLVPLCTRYANLRRGGGGGGMAGAEDSGGGGGGSGSGSGSGSGKGFSASGQEPTKAGTPPSAQAPSQTDPVKQGLDAMRKLMPF